MVAGEGSTASHVTFKQLKASGADNIVLAENDVLVLIGDAQGDGAESPEAWSDELKVVWNQTQNFRTPVLVKGALLQASLRGANNELARLRMQKAGEHAVKISKALLRGKSALGTNLGATDTFTEANTITDANGNLIRTTMGALTSLEMYGISTESDDDQNIFDRSQKYEWSQFIDDSFKIFQFIGGEGVRDAFCGPTAMSYWSKIDSDSKLKSKFEVKLSDMKSDKLGFNFKYLETPFGILRLIYEPGFRDLGYRNYMYIPNYNNMWKAVFTPSSYHTNILTDNRPKLVKDEYDSDLGIGITLVKSHHLIKVPVA